MPLILNVKKNMQFQKIDWKLGVLSSILFSMIAFSLFLIRMDEIRWTDTLLVVTFTFLYCFLCWLIHSSLLKRNNQLKFDNKQKRYAALSIMAAGFLIFGFDLICGFFSDRIILFNQFSYQMQGPKKYFGMLLRAELLSCLYYFILYYTHILREKQQYAIEIAKLKQAQLEANLSSLKEQLSPHFLFNTLSTLSTLTREENVKNYVLELANVYRYVVLYEKKNKASLKEELKFIESYLYILKTRMENAIMICINVDENMKKTVLPPLTLQLLIENAIKHNIASMARPLKIDIYIKDEEFLVVSNNFQPKISVQHSTGIGLDNIMQRYNLLFSRDIHIINNANEFTVMLPIIRP